MAGSQVYVRPVLASATQALLTTGNAYTDNPMTVFSINGINSKTLVFTAAANDLEFLIEFSPDGVNWVTRLTGIDVAVGAYVIRNDIDNAELRGQWQLCRISVRPNVAATHGTGTYWFNGGTL